MTIRSIALSALLLAAAAGCEKSNDLGRLQDEANVLVQRTAARFEELAKREAELKPRVQGGKVGAIFDDARARTTQARAMLQQAPASIASAAKTGNPEEIEKLIDTVIRERLERVEGEIIADLNTVESALAAQEREPAQVAQQSPTANAIPGGPVNGNKPAGSEPEPTVDPGQPGGPANLGAPKPQ